MHITHMICMTLLVNLNIQIQRNALRRGDFLSLACMHVFSLQMGGCKQPDERGDSCLMQPPDTTIKLADHIKAKKDEGIPNEDAA